MERGKLAAAAVSLALIGATLSPLLRAPGDDSFPLSTYPMFAMKRSTQLSMSYALGESSAGERIVLSSLLLGTGEALQAMRVIERAVQAGRPSLVKLCTAIAARVAADAEYRDVAAVRIVSGTHDAIDYLVHGVVGSEVGRIRCPVPR